MSDILHGWTAADGCRFDMDFDTTCALKAQSSGAVTVILKDVTASMRPGR